MKGKRKEVKMTLEELNSNLDYFLDVDIPKSNEEIIQTLVVCGLQECDVAKLKKLFEKLKYNDSEIIKYDLTQSKDKAFYNNKNNEDTKLENVKRIKLIDDKKVINDNEFNEIYDYDIEKICDNYMHIKTFLTDFFQDEYIMRLL